jgi:VIT1/CCC1 family predicted Fe2+/Mn2+ transporter
MNKKLISTVLQGIAVAMGVAVIVLNTLGTLTNDTAITLLSIGLTALAIAALQKE